MTYPVDADLVTLNRALIRAPIRPDEYPIEALARVEAELSRLREQRDDERREREYVVGLAGRARDRYQAAEARCARLQQALERIQQWDCINPTPDAQLCADFPWLKALVDEALAGPDTPAEEEA